MYALRACHTFLECLAATPCSEFHSQHSPRPYNPTMRFVKPQQNVSVFNVYLPANRQYDCNRPHNLVYVRSYRMVRCKCTVTSLIIPSGNASGNSVCSVLTQFNLFFSSTAAHPSLLEAKLESQSIPPHLWRGLSLEDQTCKVPSRHPFGQVRHSPTEFRDRFRRADRSSVVEHLPA